MRPGTLGTTRQVPRTLTLRLIGGAVAGAICLGIAGLGVLEGAAAASGLYPTPGAAALDGGGPSAFFGIGLAGLPVATLLGSLFAPAVIAAHPERAIRLGMYMGILTVVLASFEIVIAMTVEMYASGFTAPIDPVADLSVVIPAMVVASAVVALVGIALFGPFALLLTVPAAVVWAQLLRRLVLGRAA